MAELTFSCSKCNRRVPTNQVRMLPEKKYICFDCARYTPDNSLKSGSSLSVKQQAGAQAASPKIKYHCLKCKYEFFLKEGRPKKCPYCNGERIEEKVSAAQKLIDLDLPSRN